MANSFLQVNFGDTVGGNTQDKTTFESPQLEKSISSLTEAMSSFRGAINEFSNTIKNKKTESSSNTEQQRNERATIQKETAAIRAAVQTNPDIINQRTKQAQANEFRNLASVERERNYSSIINEGNRRIDIGDKSGQKLIDQVAANIGKGAKNALSDKTLWNTLGAVGGITLANRVAKEYISSTNQMGMALTNNPMTSGYNYGGTVSDLINLQEQRSGAIFTGGATLLGGAIGGALGGVKGATMGGAALGGIASTLSSYDIGKTAIESKIIGSLVNNRMQIESLRGTNAPAYELQKSAMGNHSLKDLEVPFITAVSKAVGVYNDNSKAMSNLTKNIVNFSQAAQLDMGQAAQIGGAAGLLSRDKSFSFDKAKEIFNTYGTTDYVGAFNSAINFRQAGFSGNQSVLMASQLQSANPGFQQATSSFFGNSTQRARSDLISQAFGVNTEALYNRNSPGHKAAVSSVLGIRNKYLRDIKFNNYSDAILQSNLYNLSSGGADITQAPIFDSAHRKLIDKSVGPTGTQNAINHTLDKFLNNNGSNASETSNNLIQLGTGFHDASQALGTMTNTINSVTSALSGLASLLHDNHSSGYNSNRAGSTQSKKH